MTNLLTPRKKAIWPDPPQPGQGVVDILALAAVVVMFFLMLLPNDEHISAPSYRLKTPV